MTRSTSMLVRVLAALVLAFGLAACGTSDPGNGGGNGGDDGGNGGDDGGSGGVADVGFVAAFEMTLEGGGVKAADAFPSSFVTAIATFERIDASYEPDSWDDPWASVTDTCFFTEEGGEVLEDPFASIPSFQDPESVALDAGAEVRFATDGSAFLDLTRDTQQVDGETTVTYLPPMGTFPPSSLPADLHVSADGGGTASNAFPAFTAEDLPDVAPLVLTQPTDRQVTSSTTFQWTATGSGNALVVFVATDPSTERSLGCFAADDGELSVASSTDVDLSGFSGTLDGSFRWGLRKENVGDAVLLLTTARGTSYDMR